jgi:hypothetical protein
LVLFSIGVFDIFFSLVELTTSGRFVDPAAVTELLDTVLLLLILVAIHRTLVAYVRREPVIHTVAGVAAIAMGGIGFRSSEFETGTDALTAADAFSLLLLIEPIPTRLPRERAGFRFATAVTPDCGRRFRGVTVCRVPSLLAFVLRPTLCSNNL